MSNSVDTDEMAHYEPSHLDLCCLQTPIRDTVKPQWLEHPCDHGLAVKELRINLIRNA